MGVYLHPAKRTDDGRLVQMGLVDVTEEDKRTLEKLANVSEGTFERVKMWRGLDMAGKIAENENNEAVRDLCGSYLDMYGPGYTIYKLRKEVDPEAARLDDFLMSGWGKFSFPHRVEESSVGNLEITDTTSQWDVGRMISSATNGVTFNPNLNLMQITNLIDGVCWG